VHNYISTNLPHKQNGGKVLHLAALYSTVPQITILYWTELLAATQKYERTKLKVWQKSCVRLLPCSGQSRCQGHGTKLYRIARYLATQKYTIPDKSIIAHHEKSGKLLACRPVQNNTKQDKTLQCETKRDKTLLDLHHPTTQTKWRQGFTPCRPVLY